MTEAETAALLKRYSEGRISVSELRRALGGITFADVLIQLAQRDLPLPRAPETGREQRIAAARMLLFPEKAGAVRARQSMFSAPARSLHWLRRHHVRAGPALTIRYCKPAASSS